MNREGTATIAHVVGPLNVEQNHLSEEAERCRVEITAIKALLVGGHADIEGLCLALSDWSAELALIDASMSGPSNEAG